MSNLLNNIDKIHTTKLVLERIKRNVNIDDIIITINSYNYYIITAHRR